MDKDTAIENEYKILWDYYKKSIDERIDLFTWYFRIVTLPAVLFGLVSFFKSALHIPVSGDIVLYSVGLVFILIFLAGISLYVTYTLMCNNVIRLEKRIYLIREYMAKADEESAMIFFPFVKEKNKEKGKEKRMLMVSLFSFDGVKFWRAMIIPIINSAVFTASVILVFNPDYHLIFLYVSSFLLHLVIFNVIILKNK